MITYTPPVGFSGAVSFTYRVKDNQGAVSLPVTVRVIVGGDGSASPLAMDDVTATTVDTPVTIDVLANDGDEEDEINPSTVEVISPPARGSAQVDPFTGRVIYTPDQGFVGVDTFSYIVLFGEGSESNVATVTVTVSETDNDRPSANDDAAVTRRGVPVAINVLANDTDADGTPDRASVQVVGGPAHGAVAVDPVTGVITYTPAAGYVGADSFTYTVKDDAGATSNVATVSLVVQLPLAAGPVVVNGAAVQRSNLEALAVRFNQGTNLAALIADGSIVDAVEVVRVGGTPVRVPLAADRYAWDGATSTLAIDLTTDGFGGDLRTLLADGRYELRLHAARVRAAGTGLTLEDTEGTADGILTTRFHRLAGDFDGDATVGTADAATWSDPARVRFGARAGQAGYSVVYDLDGDGVISSRDYYLWLRTMFGRSLP